MRFEEPVDTRKRLELIRSPETDDDTVAAAVEVGKRLGKGVMVITESK